MTTYPVQYVKGVMADLLYESVTNPASYSHHDLTLQLCAEFFDPLNYKCKDLQDSVIQTVAGTLWTVPVSIYPAFDTENPVVTPIFIATYTDTDNKKKFRFSLQIEGNNDFAKSNAEVQGMFAATQQLTPAFSIFGYKMPAILLALLIVGTVILVVGGSCWYRYFYKPRQAAANQFQQIRQQADDSIEITPVVDFAQTVQDDDAGTNDQI